MNTHFGKSQSIRLLFHSALVAVLSLMPGSVQAQTGNTATGFDALVSVTTGSDNTADGYAALSSNTTGYDNTASGASALASNTIGAYNTANGFEALSSNTMGAQNTANGAYALLSNTTGYNNTANGVNALYANTTGAYNTANGLNALFFNTTGQQNTANGADALYSNTTGNYNTANGTAALYTNTTGASNTADGFQSLFSNTTGNYNAACSLFALYKNTTGAYNTGYGAYALYSNTTGSSNIALGYGAGENLTTGSNNIAIGNTGVAAESGIIRIGTTGTQTKAYIAGINGVTASGGVAVYINANGQLGTLTSSARFKYDIHTMGEKSEQLMKLRPVSFRYKEAEEDGSHPQQYGLIAEEVAKIYPDLVQYDKEGKPFTVYYHLLTPLMLNELQKAHRRSEEQAEAMKAQKAEIDALKVTVQAQGAALEALRQAHQPAQSRVPVACVLTVGILGALFLTTRTRAGR